MLKVVDFKNISLNLKRSDYLRGIGPFLFMGSGGGELGGEGGGDVGRGSFISRG